MAFLAESHKQFSRHILWGLRGRETGIIQKALRGAEWNQYFYTQYKTFAFCVLLLATAKQFWCVVSKIILKHRTNLVFLSLSQFCTGFYFSWNIPNLHLWQRSVRHRGFNIRFTIVILSLNHFHRSKPNMVPSCLQK